MFHSYETLEQAEADGWTRSVAMVDITEPPSFGYDWAVKDEDGNIVARSTGVYIRDARNVGGSTGAVYPMFKEEEAGLA